MCLSVSVHPPVFLARFSFSLSLSLHVSVTLSLCIFLASQYFSLLPPLSLSQILTSTLTTGPAQMQAALGLYTWVKPSHVLPCGVPPSPPSTLIAATQLPQVKPGSHQAHTRGPSRAKGWGAVRSAPKPPSSLAESPQQVPPGAQPEKEVSLSAEALSPVRGRGEAHGQNHNN